MLGSEEGWGWGKGHMEWKRGEEPGTDIRGVRTQRGGRDEEKRERHRNTLR